MHVPDICLFAGEASGDMYCAALCRELLALSEERDRKLRLRAWAGPQTAAAGVELVEDLVSASTMGMLELVGSLPRLFGSLRRARKHLQTTRPGLVILIDNPAFNLRLLDAALGAGCRVAYFVPPKVWAWRPGRAAVLKRKCDAIFTIFPFEGKFFRGGRARVYYEGNPLVDLASEPSPPPERGAPAAGAEARLLLLPGSRKEEVRRLLPPFLEAASMLERRGVVNGIEILRAPTPACRTLMERILEEHGAQVPIREAGTPAERYACMDSADAALAASGTVVLECALRMLPVVAAYRVNPLSGLLFRMLRKVEFVTLPNLILGEECCPELLQSRAAPAAMAEALEDLLTREDVRRRQLDSFRRLRRMLGARGVLHRTAERIMDDLID